jgi:hypothetical protein
MLWDTSPMPWISSTRHVRQVAAATLLSVSLLGVEIGCGGPSQVGGENRELIVSLATAVSARNASWLDKNAKLLEQRHAEGKCSDAEYATFKAIIEKARAGDWKSAEDSVYALRDAQEPTAQDLENVAQRKLGKDHGIPKTLLKSSRRSR